MLSFSDSNILVRRKDGSVVNLNISPYPILLFEFTEKGKWEKAIKLCRFVKESTLWASLAGLSL
jgi:intraflagellar transport protein 80